MKACGLFLFLNGHCFVVIPRSVIQGDTSPSRCHLEAPTYSAHDTRVRCSHGLHAGETVRRIRYQSVFRLTNCRVGRPVPPEPKESESS